tara:strand:+ start:972 stop:1139 length:168 start_codon:yes stop_codon:yes gene_type:complete
MAQINQLEIIDQVIWFNYKGYHIRVEKDANYNNGNLLITVHENEDADYIGRLEVE